MNPWKAHAKLQSELQHPDTSGTSATVDDFAFLRHAVYLLVSCAMVACALAFCLFGQSESMEWRLYAAGCVLIPVAAFAMAGLRNTRSPRLFAPLLALVCALALLPHAVWAGSLTWTQLTLFLPLPLLVAWLRHRGGNPWRRASLVDALAWNIIAVIAAASVILPVVPSLWVAFPLGYALVLLPPALLRWPMARFMQARAFLSSRPRARALLWLLFAAGMSVVYVLRQTYVDYPHYAYYVGPTFDALLGKSLLWDTPSLYGYFDVHFMAAILRLIGASFGTYYAVHAALYLLWIALCIAIIWKVVAVAWARCALVLFMALLAATSNIDPLMGALRYGMPTLIIACLIFAPARIHTVAATLLAAFSMWWAFDVAIQIAVAWPITLALLAVQRHGLGIAAARETCGGILLFAGMSLVCTGVVVWMEQRPGAGFPPLDSYLLSSLMRTSGDTPVADHFVAFGSQLGAGFLCVVSVALVCQRVFRARAHWLLPAFCFSTFHLVVLLSRFVNLSYSGYLYSFVILITLHLVLLGVLLRDELRCDAADGALFLRLPVTLLAAPLSMVLLLSYLTREHVMLDEWMPPSPVRSLYKERKAAPLLEQVRQRFGGPDTPIVILSPHDTKLVVESGIPNALPLNPFNTLPLVLHGQERFLLPALSRLEADTLVLSTRTLPQGKYLAGYKLHFEREWRELLDRFQLEPLGTLVDTGTAPGMVSNPGEGVIYEIRRIARKVNLLHAPPEERLPHYRAMMMRDHDLLPAYERFDATLHEAGYTPGEQEKLWRAFMEEAPNASYGRLYLAKVLMESHGPEAGEQQVEQALLLQPDNALALRMAGNVRARLGKCDAALAAFEQLARLQETNFAAVAERTLLRLRALKDCGRSEEYETLRQAWMESSGSNPEDTLADLPEY